MTQTSKRILSVALTFLLVLSVLVGGLPTQAEAKTGTKSKNTGTRNELSISLSSQAEAYYTGDYTWESLSDLQGGTQDCVNTDDNELYQALHELMESTMTNSLTYKNLKTQGYIYSDTTASNTSSYSLIYSSKLNTDYNNDLISREHVWPKSHASFHKNNGGCDLHHLRPEQNNVNTARGNYVLGNVKNVYTSYTTYSFDGDVVFYKYGDDKSSDGRCEIPDNVKGDIARILLYVWCRWEQPNLFTDISNPIVDYTDNKDSNKNDGIRVIESLETLLQWCQDDPVDTWEMSRNDSIENIQGNRNVFIDYPELAWMVFGLEIPTDLVTPTHNDGVSNGGSGNGNTSGGNGNTSDGNGSNNSGNGNSGNNNSGNGNSGNNSNDVNWVSTPSAETPYQLAYVQTNKGNQTYYFNGTLSSDGYYLGTTTNVSEAKDIYLESVSGGYHLYFKDGSNTKYLKIYTSGSHVNAGIGNVSEASVFTWDSTYHTFVTSVSGVKYFLGTYSTYTSISACNYESYISSNIIAKPCGEKNGNSTVTPPATEPTTAPTTAPTESTGATEPTVSTDPTDPTDPTDTTQPTETVDPTNPIEPTETVVPSETVNPTDGTQPSTTKPTETTPTVQPGNDTGSPVVLIVCIVIAVAAIGGACYYFLVYKKKNNG